MNFFYLNLNNFQGKLKKVLAGQDQNKQI